MKKYFKHISALAVAIVMAVAFCVPAFAAEGDSGHEDTNLTYHSVGSGELKELPVDCSIVLDVGVSDPETGALDKGDKLLFFKVVDIVYNKEANELTYTFTELFEKFLASDEGAAWSQLAPAEYGKLSDSELKPLLGTFTAYLRSGKAGPLDSSIITATSAGSMDYHASVNLPAEKAMGQFIAIGNGNEARAKIYQTVTVNVEPIIEKNADGKDVYKLYSIYTTAMKTSKPSIEKTIVSGTAEDDKITTGKLEGDKHEKHQHTASIGDEITYNLRVNVPVYPEGATNKTFYVGDTLSTGLKFSGDSIVVKGFATAEDTTGTELTEADGAYTKDLTGIKAEENGGTFYVDFNFDKIAAYHHVTIEYKAAVTDGAKIGTTEGNPNDADLIYSNDPFVGNTWKPGENRPTGGDGYGKDEDKEIVYTYAFVIDKFEENQENKKLSGAEFEIYTSEIDGEPMKDSEGNVIKLVTDENGAAQFKGLKAGTYWLKETKAPTGYNLSDERFEVTLDAQNTAYTTEESQSVTHYTFTTAPEEALAGNTDQAKLNGSLVWMNADGNVQTGPAAPAAGYLTAYVKEETTTTANVITINKDAEGANGFWKAGIANSNGMHLPSTGGIGTTIFYVVGGLLMVGAVILLITKRRMGNKE